MKNLKIRFLPVGIVVAALLIFAATRTEGIRVAVESARSMLASVFFADSVTERGLLERYSEAQGGGAKVKLIIVPGHDDKRPGAVYKGRREADMTAELGQNLRDLFSKDSEFEVALVRTAEGYDALFWDYRERSEESLYEFIKSKKADMQALMLAGLVDARDGVKHNKAPKETVTTLYSVNRWANETDADIVLHIHFNDAAERKREAPYDYSGFAVYIPEKQYSNAKASRAVAEKVFGRLSRFMPKSDLPIEDSGLVESQDLIAVGAYNTLDPVGLLIEYGYIYEPQYDNADVRKKAIEELAFQTYLGIHDFFKTEKSDIRVGAASIEGLKKVSKDSNDKSAIFDFQKALLLSGAYPPVGKTLRECPLTGNFGQCTLQALRLFQIAEKIEGEEGMAGERTLATLAAKLESGGL